MTYWTFDLNLLIMQTKSHALLFFALFEHCGFTPNSPTSNNAARFIARIWKVGIQNVV